MQIGEALLGIDVGTHGSECIDDLVPGGAINRP